MIPVDSDKALRWIKTSVVLLAMTNSGVNVGIFSPSLPDIAYITSSTTAAMSTTLIWTGIFSMVGAIVFGPLFDKFDGMGVLAAAVFLQGVFLALTPWCPELVGFQIFAALTCFFNFGIMAGTVSVNCVIWQKHPEMISPIVQITDLMHALGAAITPQIIEPFVGKHNTDNSSDIPYYDLNVTVAPNTTFFPPTHSPPRPHGVQPVQIAYVIVAIFDILVAVICFVCYLFGRDRDDSKLKSYEYEKHRMIRRRSYSLNEDGTRLFGEEEPATRQRSGTGTGNLANMVMRNNLENGTRNEDGSSNLRKLLQERRQQRMEEQKKLEAIAAAAHGADSSVPDFTVNAKMISLLVAVFFFFMLNGGRDALLSGLLFTYLNTLGWSPKFGTLLITLYHVTRVVIHIAVVFLAKYVSPLKITIANQLILVASAGFMLATVHDAQFFLAIGIILTGFATSSLHPTAITLAQKSFKVTGKMMGIFFGGIGSGSIVFSPVAGYLIQTVGPVSFPAMLLAISVGASVLLVVWVVLARVVHRMFQVEEELEDMPIEDQSERTQLLS